MVQIMKLFNRLQIGLVLIKECVELTMCDLQGISHDKARLLTSIYGSYRSRDRRQMLTSPFRKLAESSKNAFGGE